MISTKGYSLEITLAKIGKYYKVHVYNYANSKLTMEDTKNLKVIINGRQQNQMAAFK
jgi:hypothetical protein